MESDVRFAGNTLSRGSLASRLGCKGALLARRQQRCEQWPAAPPPLSARMPGWRRGLHTSVVSVCSNFILLMRTDTVCSILHKLGVIHRFLANSWIFELNIILRRFLCKWALLIKCHSPRQAPWAVGFNNKNPIQAELAFQSLSWA